MNSTFALGVIGGGHIAGIIVKRLIQSGYCAPQRIVVTTSRALQAHPMPVCIVPHAADVARQANHIMIAVTPQRFTDMAATIRDLVTDQHLLISVMAGMPAQRVAEAFATDGVRVIRCMPNLPFGLGHGVTGMFRGQHATADDMEFARRLFTAGGRTGEVTDEAQMDAVTAVAGSGPAYFYYFVEAMMAAGRSAGLAPDDAQTLAAYACMGAGAMLLERDASPRELRDAVTSPGGTTEAAMKVLTNGRVTELVTEAVAAAVKRGRELGARYGTPSGK